MDPKLTRVHEIYDGHYPKRNFIGIESGDVDLTIVPVKEIQ